MDGINIKSKFFTRIISAVVEKQIFKKTGADTHVDLENLQLVSDDNDVCIGLNLTIKLPKNEFVKSLKRFGIL